MIVGEEDEFPLTFLIDQEQEYPKTIGLVTGSPGYLLSLLITMVEREDKAVKEEILMLKEEMLKAVMPIQEQKAEEYLLVTYSVISVQA